METKLSSKLWLLVLALVPLLVFFPVCNNGFVNWDDAGNLLENFQYRGLGWPQVSWAWTHSHVGEYRPLAWIMYSIQYTFWGLDPRAYHVVGLCWHIATTVMLAFCALRIVQRCCPEQFAQNPRAVKAITLITALVFQVHPLRTEVVAWVSIQSYLPSTFFFLLAVFLYFGSSIQAPSKRRLVAIYLCFLVSLLFKVISMPLPLVLLIADYYVLGRFKERESAKKAILEKIPLFALSLLFGLLAVWAKQEAGSLEATAESSLWSRIAQASYGLAFFPIKTLLPIQLRALYSQPEGTEWTSPLLLASFIFAVSATGVSAHFHKRWPAVTATWLAYLILLFPNLGVIKSNFALTADRYGYLPMMAALPLSIYLLCICARRVSFEKIVGLLLLVVIPLGVLSWRQSETWHSSFTLWANVIAQGDKSPEARNNIGGDLLDHGRADEAYPYFLEALRLKPTHIKSLDNLGLYYFQKGNTPQAARQFSQALQQDPGNARILGHLAVSFLQMGNTEAGWKTLQRALRIQPSDPDLLSYRGLALAQDKQFEAAARDFSQVLELRPTDENARRNLANALEQQRAPSPP